ncbi:MAG: hypothetical protein JWO99_543 [Candidatus Saccharibacteria bacterium]|nr:hypothetical protein [Candidatus Saccharibacteria bacterium]
MQPIIIDFDAPTFSKISNDLFAILGNHRDINRLEISLHTLTFKKVTPDEDLLLISVAVDEPIEQFELIAFLVSPGIGNFGREDWLAGRFDHFGSTFSINIDGDSVIVGEIPKRR